VSKGAKILLEIVQQIYPNQRIELEHNIAPYGGLYLDIYLPRLNVAFEFDGEQHFKFIEHFHGTAQNFIVARKRDLRKDDLCEEQGITLIRVAYNEPLTREHIVDKIEEALDG